MPAGVRGAKPVADRLRAIGLKPGGAALAAARREALAPMLAVAKGHLEANHSVHRGVLLNGLVIVDRGRNASRITAEGAAVRIAHLVEFGTAPHWQPRRHMMHPGARPKPFLRPAFEEMRGAVVARFG